MEKTSSLILDFLLKISNTPYKKAGLVFSSGMFLYLLKSKFSKIKIDEEFKNLPQKQNNKGNVDKEFFKKLFSILKIAFPKLFGKETLNLSLFTLLLIVRTFLSIWVAELKGSWVRSIVQKDFQLFVKHLIMMMLYSFPSSLINSGLDYLNRKLALLLRVNISNYFHKKYFENLCFYKFINLDGRISNPDQIFVVDINNWANSVSNLYSNLFKPLLDLILLLDNLSKNMGFLAPACLIGWYVFSAIIIKIVSPPFGKLIAINQTLEGEFGACHSSISTHSEEIAFYRGQNFEKKRLENSLNKLMNHNRYIAIKKFYIGVFDSFLTKYFAVLTGYILLGVPVFTNPLKHNQIKVDSSLVTRDFVRDSGLLVNLSKAIGKIISSYKNFQSLAGYTLLVDELKNIMSDISKGNYYKSNIANKDKIKDFTGGRVSKY